MMRSPRPFIAAAALTAALAAAAPAAAATAPSIPTQGTEVADGVAPVALKCTGGPCKGTLALTLSAPKGGKKKGFVLGSASFSIAKNKAKAIDVKLSKTGLKLVPEKGALKVTAVAKAGKAVKKGTVSLSRFTVVDACTLITPADAAKVTGEAMGPGVPKTPAADNTTQCVFSATANSSLVFIVQITQGPDAATAFENGRDSLPSAPVPGVGDKAYQVNETGTLGALFADNYLILSPPGTLAKNRDLTQLPGVAKTALSALE